MNEATTLFVQKPWLLIVLCSLSGYLIGSVSFARIVYFIVTKNKKIEPFSEPVPHSEETFESDLVSATLVTKKIGARYGCMTSFADMLKVAVPTLLVKLFLPRNLTICSLHFLELLVIIFRFTTGLREEGENLPYWVFFS